MPKFKVILGRLVRESATIIVEAPDIATLDARLSSVYDAYEGPWTEDLEWGAEESDSHQIIVSPAIPSARVDVTLK